MQTVKQAAPYHSYDMEALIAVLTGKHIYNLKCITAQSNLIPIAALTQSIENELA